MKYENASQNEFVHQLVTSQWLFPSHIFSISTDQCQSVKSRNERKFYKMKQIRMKAEQNKDLNVTKIWSLAPPSCDTNLLTWTLLLFESFCYHWCIKAHIPKSIPRIIWRSPQHPGMATYWISLQALLCWASFNTTRKSKILYENLVLITVMNI